MTVGLFFYLLAKLYRFKIIINNIDKNLLFLLILSGIFDWLADILSNFLSPTLDTFGTNFLQCLDQGPRILYTPLDLELNTPKPGIARVVETTTQTIIEGKTNLELI